MKKKITEEVHPGIFKVTERGILGLLKPPVNLYIITGKNGLVYDSGYGDRRSIKRFINAYNEINDICTIRNIENSIDRILLSHAHADHFSGLKKLRKLCGFKILITDEMKKILSSSKAYTDSYAIEKSIYKKSLFKRLLNSYRFFIQKFEFIIYSLYWGISFVNDPDIIIKPQDKIIINDEEWDIFRSPGHSTEHITLYNREKGILFSGDNVLKSINVWLGPPKSDIDEYENSLKQILDLEGLKIILPAHGSPIHEPYKRITEIIGWRKKRTDDLIKILTDSSPEGLSIKQILNKLYPSDTRMKKEFASGWIELTLQKLEREKKIKRIKNLYTLVQ